MADRIRSREELAVEVERLRRRVAQLERREAGYEAAERDLRQSRDRLELAIKGGQLDTWVIEAPTTVAFLGERTFQSLGYSPEDYEDPLAFWRDIMHPEDRPRVFAVQDEALEGRRDRYEVVYRLLDSEGRWRRFRSKGAVVERDGAGQPLRLAGVVWEAPARNVGRADGGYESDREAADARLLAEVEERRSAEERIRALNQFRESIIDTMDVMICVVDREERCVVWNRAAERLTGYGRDEVLGQSRIWEWLYPEEPPRGRAQEALRRAIGGDAPVNRQTTLRARDGSERILSCHLRGLRNERNEPVGAVYVGVDLTDRMMAERALRETQETFNLFLDQIPGLAFIKDGKGALVYVNRYMKDRLGAESWLGRSSRSYLTPALAERASNTDRRALEFGPVVYEETLLDMEGQARAYRICKFPVRPQGREALVAAVGFDISDLRRAEAALRESEERFRVLFEDNQNIILLIDPVGGEIVDANPKAARFYGLSRERMRRMRLTDLTLLSRDELAREIRDTDGGELGPGLFRHRRADGQPRDVDIRSSPVTIHRRELLYTIVHDVTDARRAERERERLEARLRQSQKLDSLAELAGGVAHDFNNLLTGILGNADLAMMDLPADSPTRDNVGEIIEAAQRASRLASQMLAYSGRGCFVKRMIDLSELVSGLRPLLESSVSGRAELRFDLAGELPRIHADADQLRQTIVSLVANASEAIEGQDGLVQVVTGSAEVGLAQLRRCQFFEDQQEGRYVYLDVIDDGVGMDAEARERLFDPFYSTKFPGRGLGLAATMGIVRAHRGAILVSSRPGQGTHLRVLFPVADDARGASSASDRGAGPEASDGPAAVGDT